MISLTTIGKYMVCPMGLYNYDFVENRENDDLLLKKTLKELRIDLMDLLQRNMRRITKDMDLSQIEECFCKNMNDYIRNSFTILRKTMPVEDVIGLKDEIKRETLTKIKILSLKLQDKMLQYDKDGNEFVEYFFPTAIYSYLMKDDHLEIIGNVDKIEIVQGQYYPINYVDRLPVKNGVYDDQAIKLVAGAMLIEQEFDTECFVGYVEDVGTMERRAVVFNAQLRKALFRTLKKIGSILNGDSIPDEYNANKEYCSECCFKDTCLLEFEEKEE